MTASKFESTRYPFCFYGEPTDPESTRGILEVLPFNAELNRLELWVTGASTPRLKVTWEARSKFSARRNWRKGKPGRRVPGQPVQRALQSVEYAVSKQQQWAPRVHIIEELGGRMAQTKQCAVHRVWRRSWNWKLLRATPLSPLHTLTITPVP